VVEIDVSGQQSQLVTNTQLSQQCVNRPCLDTTRTAKISQFRGGNMIIPVRAQKRKCGEALDDLLFGFGSGETLQELLED
jgi:hypothetical protein